MPGVGEVELRSSDLAWLPVVTNVQGTGPSLRQSLQDPLLVAFFP